MRRRAMRPASRSASASPSSRATPRSTERPDPISPTVSPPTTTRARATRWTTARKNRLLADPRAVVLALGLQRAGELVVPARLVLAPEVLEAAPERVVRIVVGLRDIEVGAEFGLGLDVPPDAEVGDPVRLADRSLSRLPLLGLLERDSGLSGHA